MLAPLRFSLGAALATALLWGSAVQAQTTVIVGTGTTAGSTNVLLATSTSASRFSRAISIYTAAELRAAGASAGTITRIGWYKDGTGEYPSNDAQLTILLKRTSAGSLPGNPVTWATEVAGATPVFSSTALSLPTGTGWKDFTLSTPFAWNGTDNLEVLVDWVRASAPTASIEWRFTPTPAGSGLHAAQVNTALIPTVGYSPNRPNIQLTFLTTTAARSGRKAADWASVAPNPFSSQLTMRFATPLNQPVEAILTDALGRVQQRQLLTARAEQILPLPPALAPGLYLLTLRRGEEHQTVRLVRQ